MGKVWSGLGRGEAGSGPDPAFAGAETPEKAGRTPSPRAGSDWAGLPEELLAKVAEALVAQHEAGWAAQLQIEYSWMTEEDIQRHMARCKRGGNCLFVFARVCKGWRKAQLKVGGPLRTRVPSDVILPGSVALVKWALAEGCPRDDEDGTNMADCAALLGHTEVVKWLCGEGGFAMDEGVMAWAARSGNLELVQWLRGEGCPWDEDTCYWPFNKGHVEVLRWARENGCPWTASTRDEAANELGYTDDLGNLVEASDDEDDNGMPLSLPLSEEDEEYSYDQGLALALQDSDDE